MAQKSLIVVLDVVCYLLVVSNALRYFLDIGGELNLIGRFSTIDD